MPIKDYINFNDIGQNSSRGIRIEPDDLKIFGRNQRLIDFGTNPNDVIEVALYDTNNNLLAWGIKDPNQIILDAGDSQVSGHPRQIVLDPNFDIQELGFDKGNYKISYQFFRNRFGSVLENEKAFIQEISPSREEIRILPLLTIDDILNTQQKIDFENFKDNVLDNIDVISTVTSVLTVENIKIISDKLDGLFIQQFQNEFNLTTDQFNQLLNDIVIELENKLNALIRQEENMTQEKLDNLFTTTLSEILNDKIPNTSSSTENSVLNTFNQTFITLEDLTKRIEQSQLDIIIDINTNENTGVLEWESITF